MVNALVLLVVVGGALLVGLAGLMWLVKRGTFEPNATNTDTGEEREEMRARDRAEDFSVPLRRRVKALPGPARILILVMGALVVGFAALTYQILQAGKPLTQVVDVRIAAASLAVIGLAGGVRLERWLQSRVRYAYVFFEREGGAPDSEAVPFMADSREFRDGDEIVKEVSNSRLFGLVWRYRQVAERRGLRESESLPEDIVEHMVPDHAWECPDGNVVIRTHRSGDKVLTGAAEPDKTYSSPRQLSREESIKLREQRRRVNAELKNVKATNAELMRQIRKLRKKIKTEEYTERSDLLDDLDTLLESLAPLVNEHQDSNDRRPEPAEAVQNGSGGDD